MDLLTPKELEIYTKEITKQSQLKAHIDSRIDSSIFYFWFFVLVIVGGVWGIWAAFGGLVVIVSLFPYTYVLFSLLLHKYYFLDNSMRKVKDSREITDPLFDTIKQREGVIRAQWIERLSSYFNTNLFRKRHTSTLFADHLETFTQMLREVDDINSLLQTTKIPTKEYKEYIVSRSTVLGNENVHFSSEEKSEKVVLQPHVLFSAPRKVDWEVLQKIRKEIGDRGENVVLSVEREYLNSIGKKKLAEQVSLVAEKYGDGLGYDVLSFFEDGREKYIEVKSSTQSVGAPCFLSSNEVDFLKQHVLQSFVYRVWIAEDNVHVQAQSTQDFLKSVDLFPTQFIARSK